jgi:cell division septum initiation protein DivIVA
MTYGQQHGSGMQGSGQTEAASQEAFLASFTRVPSGLDPTEVYSYFLRLSARLQELEERAQRNSAPFVLEAALREAAEIRSQHAAAAERAYNEVVSAAQQESDRLRGTSQRQADEVVAQARAQADELLSRAQTQADEVVTRARGQAEQLEREAAERTEQAETELERLCVDYASFLQRLLERRKGQGGAQTAPTTPVAAAWAAESTTVSYEQASTPVASGESTPSTPSSPPPTSAAATPPASASASAPAEKTADNQGDDGFKLPSWLE